MKRIQSPRGQVLLSVVLALLVGAFLLPPTVSASDVGGADDDGLYIGGGHNGSGGGKNNQGGGQGGDDTDPDWWTMSIRFEVQESEKIESPVIRSVRVAGPFGGFISWLLKEASSQYLSLWK